MPKITSKPFNRIVAVRLTERENEVIEEIAKHLKMKKSQLLRFLLREALAQIHGIGGEKDDEIQR